MKLIMAAALLLLSAAPSEAFNCGHYLRQFYGLGPSYGLALNWAGLRRSGPAPGTVVVQRRTGRALGGGPGGHVSRIVSIQGRCRAVVHDNRGTYSRDICKNLVAYVRP